MTLINTDKNQLNKFLSVKISEISVMGLYPIRGKSQYSRKLTSMLA